MPRVQVTTIPPMMKAFFEGRRDFFFSFFFSLEDLSFSFFFSSSDLSGSPESLESFSSDCSHFCD